MTLENGKYYKHSKRDVYIKVIDRDHRNYINIRYADGRKGLLISDPPGWKEIIETEWQKVAVEVDETLEDISVS